MGSTAQPPEAVTYLLAPIAVQEFLDLLESEDGMLDPVEEGTLPAYGARHRRVVLVQRRVVQVVYEDLINDVDLKRRVGALVSRPRAVPDRQDLHGGWNLTRKANKGWVGQSLGPAEALGSIPRPGSCRGWGFK